MGPVPSAVELREPGVKGERPTLATVRLAAIRSNYAEAVRLEMGGICETCQEDSTGRQGN